MFGEPGLYGVARDMQQSWALHNFCIGSTPVKRRFLQHFGNFKSNLSPLRSYSKNQMLYRSLTILASISKIWLARLLLFLEKLSQHAILTVLKWDFLKESNWYQRSLFLWNYVGAVHLWMFVVLPQNIQGEFFLNKMKKVKNGDFSCLWVIIVDVIKNMPKPTPTNKNFIFHTFFYSWHASSYTIHV